MLRIRALCARILTQFGRDRRTLALLFVAPVLVLWLLTVILNGTAASVHVATVDLPEALQTQLSKTDAHIERADASQAKDLIDADDVAAVLSMDGDTLRVELEGTDTGKSQQVMAAVNEAMAALRKEHQSEVEAAQREAEAAMQRKAEQLQSIMANPQPKTQQRMASAVDELMQAADPEMEALAVTGVDTVYLHGGEDWKIFDFYGPVFIGIFLFVFTFITSGMSLVTERTGGTMTRFLTTPISGAQILSGYTAAFGVLSFVQSFIILGISIRFIGFPCVGNMWFLVLTCMLLAMTSVSLGLLVSALART
ncbi:MAG: ABC transporter permease, partial [Bifidobacterium merycicum]|nr:ABC transporter permease [Bifidobacterium merycicum]